MKFKAFMWSLCVLVATSCASYRPIAQRVGQPDYNQRIVIERPEYSIQPNAIGYAVGVGLPVAGAAAGVLVGPVQTQSAEGRTKSVIGSAVFGALVGSGASYIGGLIAGYRKNVPASDAERWAERAGGDYIVISSQKGGKNIQSMTLMDRNVESHYQVKSIADIRDFALAFPKSRHMDEVFDAALSTLPRRDLPALLDAMPKAAHADKAVARYIDESPSFNELTKALAKYPTSRDVESIYVRVVSSADDALKFNDKYPRSKNKRKVVAHAFRSADNPIDQIRKMKSVFGKDFELDNNDLSKVKDEVRRNYYLAQVNLLQQKNKSTLGTLNDKYSWLSYSGKDQDILDLWWTACLNGQSSGRKVIDDLGQLVKKGYAANAGIDGKRIKDFTEKKLAEVIKEKVKATSVNTLFSGSEEFEEWLKSAYTAGMVREDQAFKVLIYGEIKNNSIFDVPVEVNMTSNMFLTQHWEPTGMAGGFLSGLKTLIEELGGSVTVDERLNNRKIPVGPLSTGSGFAIPCLAAGKTAPYAILIDFGNHKINGDVTNKKGVNFADIIKATEEVTLEDITILTSLDSRTIPQSQLKTQAEWLAMAKNGLPSSATFDVFRNQRLRQSEWDDEWRRILTTPVPRSSSSSSPAQPQIAGINYNKLKWPSEKGRIPWSGLEYDLTLLDEDEDYCMSGGTVYLTNGHNYDWRIIVRNGKTYSYDFDPGLFSSWRECDTYEEMLEEIIQYDADN